MVRRAREGERLTTLDGVVRELDPQDLLITDGPDGARIIGLAGVMGGADTEVGPGTTDVLVEAAHFDPVSIARTARRHRLPSEASKRFERGVDPWLQAAAAELAVRLLVEHGGGHPARWATSTRCPHRRPSGSPSDLPARLVGVPYARATVVAAAARDRLPGRGDVRRVERARGAAPPTWRPDLAVPADLVEEVARLRRLRRHPLGAAGRPGRARADPRPAGPPRRGGASARRDRAASRC